MIQHGIQTPQDVDRRTVPPDGRPLGEQPKWRRDFPIDWSQDEYVSRRDLVKFICLTSVAFVVGQFWIVAKSLLRGSEAAFPTLAVATVDELPVGGAKTFQYPEGSAPRLLVRTSTRAPPSTSSTVPLAPVLARKPSRSSTSTVVPGAESSFETPSPLSAPPVVSVPPAGSA